MIIKKKYSWISKFKKGAQFKFMNNINTFKIFKMNNLNLSHSNTIISVKTTNDHNDDTRTFYINEGNLSDFKFI